MNELRRIYDSLPTLDDQIRRNAESMKLFERDGMIHYGKWSRWRRATPEEAKRLLEAFRATAPSPAARSPQPL